MMMGKSKMINVLLVSLVLPSHNSYGFSIVSNDNKNHLQSLWTFEQKEQNNYHRIFSLAAYPPRKNSRGNNINSNNNDEEGNDNYDPILDEPEGKRGDARNWIEKSSPIGIGKLKESTDQSSKNSETDGNYDLGIDGLSFQTGPLSTRMFDALTSVALKRFPPGTTSLPPELNDVYKLYTMDITAKEAVKAALDQNGMELALMNENDPQSQDEGMWGDVDSIKLMDMSNEEEEIWLSDVYDNLDDAIEQGQWSPGQPFSFVVRNVPAKLKEMDISDLLTALDPEGKYRAEANEKGITMPDEDITSLKALGKDCERRTNVAPMETYSADTVYKGDDTKGYNVIKRSDLLPDSRRSDGSEDNDVLMHVMDSLVNHGCLIVDISDGGVSSLNTQLLTKMWNVANNFFNVVNNDIEVAKSLPPMGVAEGAVSPNAAVGFKSYDDGAMTFLETRIVRSTSIENQPNTEIDPKEVADVVGNDGISTLIESFDLMCDIGKDIVRIAVAAANMEYDGFLDESGGDEIRQNEESDLPFISGLTFEEAELTGVNQDGEDPWIVAEKLSSDAALKLVHDLIDDGKNKEGNDGQGRVSMSPHRLCKYVDRRNAQGKELKGHQKETFGAHTDTSFVTIVPVAAVSGLEIFDEAANKWLRPELLARQKWESECEKRGLDPSKLSETLTIDENGNDMDIEIPWHSRYICVMPGELLQVTTRNEVPAAVHRVVSESNEDARISAPVLLRARAGMVMKTEEYFGQRDTIGALLDECDGLNMEEIHDRLQPSSYRS